MRRIVTVTGLAAVIALSGAAGAQAAQYPPSNPGGNTTSVSASATPSLAYTGAETVGPLAAGLGLLGLGVVLVRRRRAHN